MRRMECLDSVTAKHSEPFTRPQPQQHHFEEIVARKERSRKTKEAAASAAAVEDGVRPDDT